MRTSFILHQFHFSQKRVRGPPGLFLNDVYSMFSFKPMPSPHLRIQELLNPVLSALLVLERFVLEREGVLLMAGHFLVSDQVCFVCGARCLFQLRMTFL